ncbi:uncharacterized protein STEHIDRAFT_102221 [Stereum hirsutum FP-91666 SS1]|uniref:uncharacterized protein n=1 Tax=Stereum hirsutum (strain FP-91666) TaxID=721885 RepID=UPI000444971A|nr:uncharacterized protein STEHIDRAFT_102221 [Stereum hirsutum FP-91666 SS1]EIM82819.1 hypothetical protein STEHIDRAFT_102221 [Stereum hirsutum FP-91666 SS1]
MSALVSEKKVIEGEADHGSGTTRSGNQKPEVDVFVDADDHQIRYKTLSWQFVGILMIAETVSNGMLSLPQAVAVVGLVPSIILTVFLGMFGLFTAKLLIDFKLNHPNVHNMGDAGYIMFGPVGREILSAGTVIFAICATGSELLTGQQALSVLSNQGLCTVDFVVIISAATFIFALPRTLHGLNFFAFASCASITLAGVLAMIGAGRNPTPGRVIDVTVKSSFFEAFLAITGPVFAYAGHFMFFILISEMRHPEEAMKSAWMLQGFSTIFYVIFSTVIYVYIGSTVQSPALLSLPPVWSKITFGIALLSFLMQVSTGALCSHTAAKLVFVRFFRHSRHVYTHTFLGWSVWAFLCFIMTATSCLLAIAIPVFSDLVGITAALFASWYTYGLAGFFWLHDERYLRGGLGRRKGLLVIAILTIIAGGFMCVAGTYVSVKASLSLQCFDHLVSLVAEANCALQLIVDAYKSGTVGKPFTC